MCKHSMQGQKQSPSPACAERVYDLTFAAREIKKKKKKDTKHWLQCSTSDSRYSVCWLGLGYGMDTDGAESSRT